jgi:hypothetical protein
LGEDHRNTLASAFDSSTTAGLEEHHTLTGVVIPSRTLIVNQEVEVGTDRTYREASYHRTIRLMASYSGRISHIMIMIMPSLGFRSSLNEREVEAFLACCLLRTFIVHSTLQGQLEVTGKGPINEDLEDLSSSSGVVELQIDYFTEGSDWTGVINPSSRGDPTTIATAIGYHLLVQTFFELRCLALSVWS